MKSKLHSLSILFLFVFGFQVILAQTVVRFTPGSVNATSDVEGITVSEMAMASNPTTPFSAVNFGRTEEIASFKVTGTPTLNEAISYNHYIEFTITSTASQDVVMDEFTALFTRATLKAVNRIAVLASSDNFSSYTSLYQTASLAGQNPPAITKDVATSYTIVANTTVKIRIYFWFDGTAPGNIAFTIKEFSLSKSAGVKDAPVAFPSNFQAVLGTPSYNTVVLTWTDAVDAEGYIIKSVVDGNSLVLPVDGIPEAESNATFYNEFTKNFNPGVQTLTITPLCDNKTIRYYIIPYNNGGINIKYKIDGVIPVATVSTTLEPDVVPISCVESLTKNAEDVIWVKGYIRGFGNTDNGKIVINPTLEQLGSADVSAAKMNVVLADTEVETDTTKMILVKFSDLYMRNLLALNLTPSNLGKYIWIKGRIASQTLGSSPKITYEKSLLNVYSYRDNDITTVNDIAQDFPDGIYAYLQDNIIKVKGIDLKKKALVYDLMGKILFSGNLETLSKTEFDIKGVLLVKVNNKVIKLIN